MTYTPKGSAAEEAFLELFRRAALDVAPGYLVPTLRLAGKHLVYVDGYLPAHHAVVEYDGAYWHRKRRTKDLRKTRALLRFGYRVARYRVPPLALLPLEEAGYFQGGEGSSEEAWLAAFLPWLATSAP